jgi:hypothetical protein
VQSKSGPLTLAWSKMSKVNAKFGFSNLEIWNLRWEKFHQSHQKLLNERSTANLFMSLKIEVLSFFIKEGQNRVILKNYLRALIYCRSVQYKFKVKWNKSNINWPQMSAKCDFSLPSALKSIYLSAGGCRVVDFSPAWRRHWMNHIHTLECMEILRRRPFIFSVSF